MRMAQGSPAAVSRWWAITIGIGVALSPVHNQQLTDLTVGQFFLPAFGYLLLIMGTGLFLLHHWDRVKEAGWGDRRIVVGLTIIVAAISLSGLNYTEWQDKVAPMGMGVALFGLYATARVLGRELYLPLLVGALLAVLGVLVAALLRPGELTGGLVFERNYDIVVGYIVLGVLLFPSKWQWIAVSLALVGLFLSGSPEGVFTACVLGAVVLLRRDWGWRLVAAATPVIIVAGIWFSLGWGQQLYSYAFRILDGEKTVAYVPSPPEPTSETDIEYIRRDSSDPPIVGEVRENAVADRWNVIQTEMLALRPLGDGYNLTAFRTNTVHNVPLVIIQQTGIPGIVAGIAWLGIGIWGAVFTRQRYFWVAMLSLSVFDHFTWTQMAPWWWVGLAGTSIGRDYLFKTNITRSADAESNRPTSILS